MNKRQSINLFAREALFLALAATLVCCTGLCLLACVQLHPEPWPLFFYTLAGVLALRLALANKATRLVSGGLLLAAALAAGLHLLWTRQPFVVQYAGLLRTAAQAEAYLRGQAPATAEVVGSLCFVVLGCLALITTALLYTRFLYSAIALLHLSLLCIALTSGLYKPNLYFLFAVACLLALLACWLGTPRAAKGRILPCKAPYNAVALGLCCLLVALAMPTPQAGWLRGPVANFFSAPFNLANDVFYAFGGPRFYSQQQNGYVDETGRLGGAITLGDSPVMSVVLNTTQKPLLRGTVADTYTGYAWLQSDFEEEKPDYASGEESVALLERMASNVMLSMYNGDFEVFASIMSNPIGLRDTYYGDAIDPAPLSTSNPSLGILMIKNPYPKTTMQVQVQEKRTYSVFFPPLAETVKIGNAPAPIVQNAMGDVAMQSMLVQGDEYTVCYRQNADISYWDSIINSSSQGVLRSIVARLNELEREFGFSSVQLALTLGNAYTSKTYGLHTYLIVDNPEGFFKDGPFIPYKQLLEDTLIPRAERIQAHYTALPRHFPQRVQSLAADIAAPFSTDYTKVQALASYLRQFPYTLSPADVPPDRDFVDYFLFDGQEGYCVYYASALVMMCRSLGIPARYVTGYMLPDEVAESTGAGKRYFVTEKQAHAWTEVYLEGYGWVTLDPTSKNDTFTPVAFGALVGLYEKQQSGHYGPLAPDEYLPMETADTTATVRSPAKLPSLLPDGAKAPHPAWFAGFALAAITALACLRALWLAGRRRRAALHYAKASPTEKTQVLYGQMAYTVGLLYSPRQAGETPASYAHRLAKACAGPGASTIDGFAQATTLFSQVKYGGKTPTQPQLLQMQCEAQQLRAQYKATQSKLRYWLQKHILGNAP